MQKQTFKMYFLNRMRNEKPFPAVLIAYLLFCIASFIYFAVIGQTRNLLMCLMYTLFVPLIMIVEKKLHIRCVAIFTFLVLFIAAGSILGACYDLYSILPWFDVLLHGIAGFTFACFGFTLLMKLIGEPQDSKKFFACLLFGIMCSLAIATLWELFEYAAGALLGSDMQEDTIINGFGSYLLSGTHNEILEVDGIVQTVIYYGNGKTIVIDGYLDIGLLDTMGDMLTCLVGVVVYCVVIAVDWFKGRKRLFRHIIPQIEDMTMYKVPHEEFVLEQGLSETNELIMDKPSI